MADIVRKSVNLWREEYSSISSSIIYVPLYVGDGIFTLSTTTPYNGAALLFLLSGNVDSGASTGSNGAWAGQNKTQNSSGGYITIAYREISPISPENYDTMLNSGTTAQIYEPFWAHSLKKFDGAAWQNATVHEF